MAHIGKEQASLIDKNEMVDDRSEDLDGGYTVGFMEFHQDVDLGQFFSELPDHLCQCPHWGVVMEGEATFRYKDGAMETVGTGEAFYIPPGHAPAISAGAKVVMFSPTDKLAATNDAIQRGMAKMLGT